MGFKSTTSIAYNWNVLHIKLKASVSTNKTNIFALTAVFFAAFSCLFFWIFLYSYISFAGCLFFTFRVCFHPLSLSFATILPLLGGPICVIKIHWALYDCGFSIESNRIVHIYGKWPGAPRFAFRAPSHSHDGRHFTWKCTHLCPFCRFDLFT